MLGQVGERVKNNTKNNKWPKGWTGNKTINPQIDFRAFSWDQTRHVVQNQMIAVVELDYSRPILFDAKTKHKRHSLRS